MTENYDKQTERLKKTLEDSYGAKLSEMQKKHAELEKQVTDATEQYEQSSKKIKDLQSFGQNMETSLQGQLKQKESNLEALKKKSNNSSIKRLQRQKERQRRDWKKKSRNLLKVVNNAQKSVEV